MSLPSPENTCWFAEEIQPHEPKLRAWLRAKFPHLPDHDDVVQDTYLRLYRAKVDGKLDHPKAYLYTTARNAALDRCRRGRLIAFESFATTDDSRHLEEPMPTAEEFSDRDRELALLTEAIRALPERCRTILVLRKHHGLSHREIADRLGISPHTVNAQITVAMIKCRAYFQQHGLLTANADET